ncbi:hypothetical protein V2J09_022688 [Rumex salicifolius]
MGIPMEETRYLLALFLFFPLLCNSLNSDGLSLLALKSAITSDPTGILSTWSDSDSTPCHWPGIRCSPAGSVVSLSLSARFLTGYLPSELGALLSLQRLSLSRNNFSMPIPSHLFNATSLLSLDLSHNSLSGAIPPLIAALSNLSSLDLSSNHLTGTLPLDLTNLTRLQGTLNLSYNQLSGPLPPSYGRLPVMVSLDLRHNNLSGEIPQVGSLLNQGPTAFSGNPGLCGFPLNNPCPEHYQNPTYPRSLNPNDNHWTPSTKEVTFEKPNRNRMAFMLLALAVLGAVVLSLWLARRRCLYAAPDADKAKQRKVVVEEDAYDEEGQKGKFVVMEEGFGLELEDLLRASAYVVGKSRSGIVYKVVVGSGKEAVAVTRLSEGDEADVRWRAREFESEADAVGRIHHPNIVRLRAYYYATHERLLVSDFIPNGSLYTALHGPHSNGTPPLSWVSRLKIAQGAARGLMHIHDCSPRKYIHGNIKSSKILLDEELRPYISGFGIHRLQSVCSTLPRSSINHIGSIKRHHPSNIMLPFKGSEIPSSSSAYLAPEVKAGVKVNQKCDIYSFGVVLMEMLTGKIPDGSPENEGTGLVGLVRKVFHEERPLSEIIDPALVNQVHVKKQVLSVFHVALSCTGMEPDLRPRMRAVCVSLEAIKS